MLLVVPALAVAFAFAPPTLVPASSPRCGRACASPVVSGRVRLGSTSPSMGLFDELAKKVPQAPEMPKMGDNSFSKAFQNDPKVMKKRLASNASGKSKNVKGYVSKKVQQREQYDKSQQKQEKKGDFEGIFSGWTWK